VIEADGRHLGHAKLAAGGYPAVLSDYLEFGIDQDRHVKAKCLNAVSELDNLRLAVPTTDDLEPPLATLSSS
jgi:hypothetical protein